MSRLERLPKQDGEQQAYESLISFIAEWSQEVFIVIISIAVLVFENEEIDHINEEVLRKIDPCKEEQGHVHMLAEMKAGDHNEGGNCKD